ncbi:pyridoxamine 5'-phosphate oxidase family protein [Actinomadura luteofluorescens]|uniref:pyridoxamine 5'-phosphate oxidase family protein n=1 Tax=Actinomadura luteofluorescens TaxID=46163 RepID=UPI0036294D3E
METTGAVRRQVAERRRDTLERLVGERDVWVSTAHPDHGPHQVPLWFLWDGRAVWMCTGAASATARNVRDEPRVRLALPDTFDVVLLQGKAECFPDQEVPDDAAEPSPPSSVGTHVRRTTPSSTCAWCQRPCAPGAASRNYAAGSSCAPGHGSISHRSNPTEIARFGFCGARYGSVCGGCGAR